MEPQNYEKKNNRIRELFKKTLAENPSLKKNKSSSPGATGALVWNLWKHLPSRWGQERSLPSHVWPAGTSQAG